MRYFTPVAGNPNAWLGKQDRCSDVIISFTDDVETDLCEGIYRNLLLRESHCLQTIYRETLSSCSQTISIGGARGAGYGFSGSTGIVLRGQIHLLRHVRNCIRMTRQY